VHSLAERNLTRAIANFNPERAVFRACVALEEHAAVVRGDSPSRRLSREGAQCGCDPIREISGDVRVSPGESLCLHSPTGSK
jgi:hypothetical protein